MPAGAPAEQHVLQQLQAYCQQLLHGHSHSRARLQWPRGLPWFASSSFCIQLLLLWLWLYLLHVLKPEAQHTLQDNCRQGDMLLLLLLLLLHTGARRDCVGGGGAWPQAVQCQRRQDHPGVGH